MLEAARAKTAVVTGATKGLGRGIAAGLLARGWRVAISGRDGAQAAAVAARLGEGAAGFACDISRYAEVQALWRGAEARFGPIDLWINNAGLAVTGATLADADPEDLRRMAETNVLGTLYGCKVAFDGLRDRGGAIYNVYGAGSDGVHAPGMIGYGTTKRAVQFLTEALAEEAAGTPVIVGAVSPGLVITEGFLREHAKTPAAMRAGREAVVNLIGDHVETVASWAVDRITANTDQGRTFVWLTPAKLRRRRRAAELRPRDVLSRYRGADGTLAPL